MRPARVILASGSPQRRMLLRALGVEFRAVASSVAETTEGEPRDLVLANALIKGRAIAWRRRRGTLVIAADTEVVVDGTALGQPTLEGEARFCLQTLSGRSHEVLGGLVLLGPDRIGGEPEVRTGIESTRVTFAELSPEMIDAYLAAGEWRGRAGGYAVQGLGAALVSGIEGDVSNVIGLPVPLLLRLAPELVGPS